MDNNNNKKRRISIIIEVAALFLVAIILTGSLMYAFETGISTESVLRQTERHAAMLAEDAKLAMTEYPAYPWLIRYWYTHADTMDIEYDAELVGSSETAEKCRVFSQRHPDLELRYLTEEQCKALPPEDQKLYAEITYSWLLTRIDQMKKSYNVEYLFCVISEEPFEEQFFLYSGAEPGARRGTSRDEAYVLGVTVSVSPAQTHAMREAIQKSNYLAYAGNYMDYYTYASTFEEHSVLIGLTFDLAALQANIKETTRTGATLAIAFQLLLSLICLLLLYICLLSPLKRVQRSIRNYSETKDSAAACKDLAKVKSRNELGQLSEDVADLTREIDAYTTDLMKITSEKERFETELELASRIQASMLPSIFPAYPERNEFEIYASMDPAKEVGGDFYDFFLIDEDHLGLVMADVSGKGVPAALFMMASKIIISHHAKAGKSPAQILTDANETICNTNPMELFVTVWMGILEISTGRLKAANAGHEYPVLKDPDGSFELLKDKHGFVVGAMEGMKYKEYEVQLEPGAKLFLYTDGVPEATNADAEMFGTDRMLDALNGDPDAAPEQLLRNVRSAVDAFVDEAEQFDDLTMLAITYHESGKQA